MPAKTLEFPVQLLKVNYTTILYQLLLSQNTQREACGSKENL